MEITPFFAGFPIDIAWHGEEPTALVLAES
jgi:hypothetical protein